MLLADDSLFEKSDELRDWRRALDVLAIDSEERKAHIPWLFRKGLSKKQGSVSSTHSVRRSGSKKRTTGTAPFVTSVIRSTCPGTVASANNVVTTDSTSLAAVAVVHH
jgi:hypothetical protein